MQKFTSDEEGSMEIIYRSRTSLWWGLAALVGWLFLLGPRLGWLVDLVPPPYDDAAYLIYSYSILGSMLGIVLCVIQLLRDRPVLRAGDRGVWFRLSLRRQGTIPWRRISGISLAPDGTTVLLHLYGGSASEETPLARPAPGGGWVLPLPLRGKIREPERAFWTLQGWYRVFGSRPPNAVPLPEAEARERRRQAAWERRGLAALRLVLTVLSVRLWVFWLLLFLLACAGVEKLLALPPPAILGICFPPFLLSYFWLRRRIRQGLAALRKAIQTRERRGSSL